MSEPCPSAETLAAYGDGKLTPAERREVEKHVAACEDCFELFAGAAAYRLEEAAEGAVVSHPATRRLRLRWSYAAAAATIVLAVWVVARQQPTVVGGAEARQHAEARLQRTVGGGAEVLALVRGLGAAGQLRAAAARAWNDDGGGLAFGGALPAYKRAFRLGVHLFDARVALEAGDEVRLEAALERVAVLLSTRGVATDILEPLRRRTAGKGGTAPHRADLDRLATAARSLDPPAFDLGAWAEAGRLAALGGRTELLASAIAEPLDDRIRGDQHADPLARLRSREPAVLALPAPEEIALQDIRAALADRQVSARELSDLERSFERLILLH